VVPSDTVNCPHSPRAALRLIGDADMPTVLIVDDYPAVRKTLRKLLEKLGSVVCIEAINGRDAICKDRSGLSRLNHSGLGYAGNEWI